MPEDTPTLEEDAVMDHFPTAPKDLSHVTLYFDTTPEDGEDESFFFVKIETPGSVDDDLDNWLDAALDGILARHPELEGAELMGAALKYGSANGKSGGGEFYHALDGDSTDVDYAPTGGLVHAREYKFYDGGAEYNYGDLFA